MYVALCLDLDIASQGETVAEARDNLKRFWSSFSRQIRMPKSGIA